MRRGTMTHGNRKLDDEQVEEVRGAWEANIQAWINYRTHGGEKYDKPMDLTLTDLAVRFRVSQGVIQNVIDKTGAYRVPHKPCPFCGGTDLYVGHESAISAHVMCRKCGARSAPVPLSDQPLRHWNECIKIALQLWNTRP